MSSIPREFRARTIAGRRSQGQPNGRSRTSIAARAPLLSFALVRSLAQLAVYTAIGSLASSLLGCTRVGDEQRFEPNPRTVEILTSVPSAGAADVSVRPQLDLCWSDLLDPRSLGDLDAIMSSGSANFDTDLEFQLRPWRGPDDAEVSPESLDAWCAGSVLSVTPKDALVPGVQYRLRLQPTAVGWAGEMIDVETEGWIEEPDGGSVFSLEFTTTTTPPPLEPKPDPGTEPAPITLSSLFEPGQIFDPERAQCSCHRDDDNEAKILLDLSSPVAAFEDLVAAPGVRDTGFVMVTPRRPSESFLLHKLLRDADGDALFGVRGDAMPPTGQPVPYLDYVALAEWIESGAAP